MSSNKCTNFKCNIIIRSGLVSSYAPDAVHNLSLKHPTIGRSRPFAGLLSVLHLSTLHNHAVLFWRLWKPRSSASCSVFKRLALHLNHIFLCRLLFLLSFRFTQCTPLCNDYPALTTSSTLRRVLVLPVRQLVSLCAVLVLPAQSAYRIFILPVLL